MNACGNSNNIIPTFTANFESQPNVSVRCMYDTAAQTSFITENAFKKLNCKVIKSKLSVNIVGFNESKQVDSKLVQLVTRMNGCSRSFNAIVVPEICTKITGKFNPIVQAFEKAQLPLADKNLGKTSTVDILIGIDAAHILPVHSCVFGPENKQSLVYHTCLGIMIAGNLNHLKSNLLRLSCVKEFVDTFNTSF